MEAQPDVPGQTVAVKPGDNAVDKVLYRGVVTYVDTLYRNIIGAGVGYAV
jgi:hypothetical protein